MSNRRRLRSLRRAAAAQKNGSLSNGPTTPEGKAKSSQNALKHGLYSEKVVLPSESPEEFEEFRDSHYEQYQPANATERHLVNEIIISNWRMRRLWEMEVRALKNGDSVGARTLDQVLHSLRRLESSLARQALQASRQLAQLRADRAEREALAAELAAEAGLDMGEEIAEEIPEQFLHLPEICRNEPNVAQAISNQPVTQNHTPPLTNAA